MEAWEVGKNRQRRSPPLGLSHQPPHGPHQRRQMTQNFGDPDHGNLRIVGHHVNSSRPHLRPAHAEYFYIRARSQRRRQPRGIHVAGGFAGRKQQGNGRHKEGSA